MVCGVETERSFIMRRNFKFNGLSLFRDRSRRKRRGGVEHSKSFLCVPVIHILPLQKSS